MWHELTLEHRPIVRVEGSAGRSPHKIRERESSQTFHERRNEEIRSIGRDYAGQALKAVQQHAQQIRAYSLSLQRLLKIVERHRAHHHNLVGRMMWHK